MADNTMHRLAVSLTGRYRVERELGAGGMATVYLAHDLKHERDVAIKVLHPDLGAALGGDRFLAEIRTTARLQHPHILPLLDSGNADGLLYYVMPLVTGETLRARLEREKLLPIDDAVLVIREVADALGYAHRLGVIHRDIKPENILLQNGHALVADFGIALAVQSASGTRVTQTGFSLGTPQYMSPEQAMGERAIDARSDIYALGTVAYEMLTGDPPFTGSTVQAIVAKVLTEKPMAPSAVRDTVSPAVEFAVLKALAKLPADRWPTTEKFAEALIRADSPLSGASRAATNSIETFRAARSRGQLIGAAVGVIAVTCVAFWLGWRAGLPIARWSEFTQLTDASGVETSPSLSPDGQSFAYASNTRGTMDIYAQRVGGRNPVLIAGDSLKDELWPAYSPDGKQIAYAVRGNGIFVAGATGESARRLTTEGTQPAWSPDGQHIVYSSMEIESPFYTSGNGLISVVDASGSNHHEINVGADGGYQPAWSPSGKLIAYWTATDGVRDVFVVPVAGGQRVQVTHDTPTDWAPVWAPDGRSLYFASDRGGTMGIWRIAVDESSGKATAPPEPVVAKQPWCCRFAAITFGKLLLYFSIPTRWRPAVRGVIPFHQSPGIHMAQSITLKKVGGSVAAFIPKDVLQRQHLAVNDEVFVIETPDGILLTAADPATKAALAAYAEVAKENRATLAALARL
ncbi:MAG: protein kinase [Gemmatimonas sp.]